MKKLCNWMNQNPEIATAVILTAFIVGLITLVITLDRLGCANRWDGIYQSQYNVLGGCRVNVEGHWLPESVIRMVK